MSIHCMFSNKGQISLFLIAGIILVSSLCRAQGAADAALGYVVRVEQSSVVLDFTEKNAAAGQPFTVFKEGEELKQQI